MKSWWFDYFSEGKLNRENTRGKTRNWEIHEKLMIWPLFKRGIWTRKHPWKTRNWEIHEKLMIWLFFKRKFKLGETPMENQEFMYVRIHVCMYVCMYECEQKNPCWPASFLFAAHSCGTHMFTYIWSIVFLIQCSLSQLFLFFVQMYICTYLHMYVHVYVCTYVRIRSCVWACSEMSQSFHLLPLLCCLDGHRRTCTNVPAKQLINKIWMTWEIH